MPDGTTINARVSRVVDGDTIRVVFPGQEEDESLRLLSLDTEESFVGGSKPVTPFGRKAKERAEAFFQPDDQVTLEFPGHEDVDTCLRRYRGNFGRLLVFVHKAGVDFQETMIREGFSPYFVKYGNAPFADHHRRYQQAEREAQGKHIGVWDQINVNGSEIRNYAALGTWWKLRASIIDEYRRIKPEHADLFDSRLDFDTIVEKANAGAGAIVFSELRSMQRVGQQSALIRIGSVRQPFSLFLPDVESDLGQEVVQLLASRYLPGDADHPRRSYAYVTGELTMFRDNPEIVVASASQITDDMPG